MAHSMFSYERLAYIEEAEAMKELSSDDAYSLGLIPEGDAWFMGKQDGIQELLEIILDYCASKEELVPVLRHVLANVKEQHSLVL